MTGLWYRTRQNVFDVVVGRGRRLKKRPGPRPRPSEQQAPPPKRPQRGSAEARALTGPEKAPKERNRRGHVFWPRRSQTLVRGDGFRPPGRRVTDVFSGTKSTVKMLRRRLPCAFGWDMSSRPEGTTVAESCRPLDDKTNTRARGFYDPVCLTWDFDRVNFVLREVKVKASRSRIEVK